MLLVHGEELYQVNSWMAKNALDEAKNGHRVYLIVPETIKAEAERALIQDYSQDKQGIMLLEILSFQRLATKILGDRYLQGDGNGRKLSKSATAFLADLLIHSSTRKWSSLSRTSKMGSLSLEATDLLAELARYDLDGPMLQQMAADLPATRLRGKLEDLAALAMLLQKSEESFDVQTNFSNLRCLSSYLRILNQARQEDIVCKDSKKNGKLGCFGNLEQFFLLREAQELQEIRVYIMGFGAWRDFTQEEYALLAEMNKAFYQLTLSLAWKEGREWAKDHPKQAYYKLTERFAPEVLNLGPPSGQTVYLASSVHLVQSPSSREEGEFVLGECIQLMENEGVDPRRIAIANYNQGPQEEDLRRAEDKYQVNTSKTQEERVRETKIYQMMVAYVKILLQEGKNEDLIGLLRLLQPEDLETIDALENFYLAHGWTYPSQIMRKEKYRALAAYDAWANQAWAVYEAWIRPRMEELDHIRDLAKKGVFSKSLQAFSQMINQEIQEGGPISEDQNHRPSAYEALKEDIEALVQFGDKAPAASLKAAWDIVNRYLEEVAFLCKKMEDQVTYPLEAMKIGDNEEKLLGQNPRENEAKPQTILKTKDLYEALLAGVEDVTIKRIPAGLDLLRTGPEEDIVNFSADYLFIMGASYENMPRPIRQGAILQAQDRAYLRDYFGVDLPDQLEDDLEGQTYLLQMLLCLPRKALYISTPTLGLEGAAKVFQDLASDQGLEVKVVTSPHSDLASEAIAKDQIEERDGPQKTLQKLDQNLEISQKKPAFLLPSLLTIGGLSASRIEVLNTCRFQYFARYGLGLQERDLHEVNLAYRGQMLHYLLEEAIQSLMALTAQASLKGPIHDEEYRQILDSWTQALSPSYFARHFSKIQDPRLRSIYADPMAFYGEGIAMQEDLKRKVRAIREYLEKERRRPILTEQEFMIERAGLPVRGFIDRIDWIPQREGMRDQWIVTDYKSSAKSLRLEDMIQGYEAQPGLYLQAVQNLVTTGQWEGKEYPLPSLDLLDFQYVGMKKVGNMESQVYTMGSQDKSPEKDLSISSLQETAKKTLDLGQAPDRLAGILAELDALGEAKTRENREAAENGDILALAKTNAPLKEIYGRGSYPCSYCPYKDLCGFDKRDLGNYVCSTLQESQEILGRLERREGLKGLEGLEGPEGLEGLEGLREND